uniref:Uncharacterized protein n=1 Tax=Anguilla anguilla TaxID=7936 RepID=A0A0E9SKN6_ANGAN
MHVQNKKGFCVCLLKMNLSSSPNMQLIVK